MVDSQDSPPAGKHLRGDRQSELEAEAEAPISTHDA